MTPLQKAKEEPAVLIVGVLLPVTLNLAASFGFELTPAQRDAVQTFAAVATPFLIAGALWLRQQVVPEAKRLREQREADRRSRGR